MNARLALFCLSQSWLLPIARVSCSRNHRVSDSRPILCAICRYISCIFDPVCNWNLPLWTSPTDAGPPANSCRSLQRDYNHSIARLQQLPSSSWSRARETPDRLPSRWRPIAMHACGQATLSVNKVVTPGDAVVPYRLTSLSPDVDAYLNDRCASRIAPKLRGRGF